MHIPENYKICFSPRLQMQKVIYNLKTKFSHQQSKVFHRSREIFRKLFFWGIFGSRTIRLGCLYLCGNFFRATDLKTCTNLTEIILRKKFFFSFFEIPFKRGLFLIFHVGKYKGVFACVFVCRSVCFGCAMFHS